MTKSDQATGTRANAPDHPTWTELGLRLRLGLLIFLCTSDTDPIFPYLTTDAMYGGRAGSLNQTDRKSVV